MKKIVLAGLEGKMSLTEVFKQMKTPETNMIVNAIDKHKKSYYRSYNEPQMLKFGRLPEVMIQDAVVIRWGTRLQFNEAGLIVYNNAEAIANSSHKAKARKILAEASVRIPKLVTAQNFSLEDLPIICRPNHHRAGQDFKVIRDPGTFQQDIRNKNGSHYFSAFVDKDAEYRVHCAHGKVLSIMSKPKPADPTIMAWNHAVNEEAFDAVKWSEWDLDMCQQALRACAALKLDFAAMDVIVKDGISYILEANTSPCVTTSPYNQTKYAMYFDWLMKTDDRREHWEFEEKKKASSLAWKDWNFEDREPNPIRR